MNKRILVPSLAWITLVFLSACNLVRGAPSISSDGGTTGASVSDQQTLVALAIQQTQSAVVALEPALTFTPSLTPTSTLTGTPDVPTVTVSTDTNCRQGGGGSPYTIVGALLVGQTAEVVGRSPSGDNWIVKLPGKTTTCWLWSYYANVVGDTSSLPIFYPESTPTFTINPYINITVVNNSPTITICEVYIMDSADSTWGNNELGGTIPPGGSYTWFNYLPGTYSVKAMRCSPYAVLKTWVAVPMFTNNSLYYP